MYLYAGQLLLSALVLFLWSVCAAGWEGRWTGGGMLVSFICFLTLPARVGWCVLFARLPSCCHIPLYGRLRFIPLGRPQGGRECRGVDNLTRPRSSSRGWRRPVTTLGVAVTRAGTPSLSDVDTCKGRRRLRLWRLRFVARLRTKTAQAAAAAGALPARATPPTNRGGGMTRLMRPCSSTHNPDASRHTHTLRPSAWTTATCPPHAEEATEPTTRSHLSRAAAHSSAATWSTSTRQRGARRRGRRRGR
ncbi:hypothetical protein BU14_0238s0011 [Porphyra umbilicalis]|uniref:Uncharacterized protein n=1 Tax=Porphyra umbilicalis TaxID=2786 RepID=A0A1X6P3H1_PORUM|nr:hypothetical protein BU14_0238s0011 [Porphyra umbilicalis]|eukprot:OSX75388.1 hypothetical protein BU14_0238s0011 [Porphyra umbilicalis]